MHKQYTQEALNKQETQTMHKPYIIIGFDINC